MENQKLIFKFDENKNEFSFDNGVSIVSNEKLARDLSMKNTKNTDSSLRIKSLDNLHISDVIQVKINVADTGSFLANFKKDSLDEETRKTLLERIGSLKSEEMPTQESQLEKTKKLIDILNDYHPIYVSFMNSGVIKLDISNLSANFPLLILKKFKVKLVLRIGKKRKSAEPGSFSLIPLFQAEYAFVFLFAMLGSLAITTMVFEFMNKTMNLAIFLAILGIGAFSIMEALAMQSSMYKNEKLISNSIRYFLALFIIAGLGVGIFGGYFISKKLLKTEIENFSYLKMLIFSAAIAGPIYMSSLFTSSLANKIIKKIKKNKTK